MTNMLHIPIHCLGGLLLVTANLEMLAALRVEVQSCGVYGEHRESMSQLLVSHVTLSPFMHVCLHSWHCILRTIFFVVLACNGCKYFNKAIEG